MNKQYDIIYYYPNNNNDFYNYESTFYTNNGENDSYYYEPIINNKYDNILYLLAAFLVFVLTPIIGILALGWFLWRLIYKPFFGS